MKLADKAILPIVVLLSARYLGLFLYGFFPSSAFTFTQGNLVLPFIKLPSEATLSANTFSWLVVAIVVAFYFGFLAFRNLHLNHDTVHPKQSSFLHNKNLEFLLVEAEEAVHQNTALLLLSAANIFFIARDFFGGSLSPLVFGLLLAEISILVVFFSQYLLLSQSLERQQVEEK